MIEIGLLFLNRSIWYHTYMTPKITDEIREAISVHAGQPVQVEDDQTRTRYVIMAVDQFEKMQQTACGAPSTTTILVDKDALRAAILARRDESRRLNADWEHADREVWDSEG